MRRVIVLALLVAAAEAIMSPALQAIQRRVSAGISSRCASAAEQMGALKFDALPGSRVATAGVFGTMAGMMLPQEAQAMPRKGGTGGRAGGGFFGKKNEEKKQPATAMNAAPAAAPAAGAPAAGGTHVVEHHHHYGGGGMYGGGISTGTFLAMSAIELGAAMHREQQRQAYLQQQIQMAQQIGRDSAQIEQLQKELAETNAKMAQIEAAKAEKA